MELWLEEVICGYCPCKFLSLTMELWLEEIICATNFYCNKFLKYMYKELVPIENLGRWIGPRRRNGPVSECPLSASAIFPKNVTKTTNYGHCTNPLLIWTSSLKVDIALALRGHSLRGHFFYGDQFAVPGFLWEPFFIHVFSKFVATKICCTNTLFLS